MNRFSFYAAGSSFGNAAAGHRRCGPIRCLRLPLCGVQKAACENFRRTGRHGFFVDSSRNDALADFLKTSGSAYFWGVFLNDSTRMIPVADLEGLASCSGRIEANVRQALAGDSIGYRVTKELSRLSAGGCAPLSALMNSPGKLTVVLLVHSRLSRMFEIEISRIRKEVAQHPDRARIVWIAMDPDCR